jgi:DNA repair protein RadA/Sms
MAKKSSSSVVFMCDNCGNELTKWSGQCPLCKEWNTVREIKIDQSIAIKHSTNELITAVTPATAISQAQPKIATNIAELDRVLGEGLTPGGVYLLAGQPGIGKSTLLTQLSLNLANQKLGVLYACSEETPDQVGVRLARLSTKTTNLEYINLLQTDYIENILAFTNKTQNKPKLIIVDSIQSVSTDQVAATAGTPSQIRACSNLLIHFAKVANIPLILVGHVTKDGTIAGPKLLEHMVDVVLELEGDRHHDLRLLRGIKNRFGPTDETGLFQMTSNGLEQVIDPSKIFLSDRVKDAPGSALAMIMEGTRPLVVEVQALTVHSELAIPRRVAQGIPLPKLQLICAILTKHLHLELGSQDVFVNVTGGFSLREPSADLAIALAILSSYKNKPIPENSVCIGELGLLGEIRNVPYLDKRLKEAKNLGYLATFNPKISKSLREIKI